MSKNDIIIEAQNLTRTYGSFKAVDDVSFACRRGEIVGFLGPNGAGKTTTMRMLTGYMPPTSGAAFIAGHNTLTESLQARRRLGYLPETVPLYDEMTVEDYLGFVGRVRRLDNLWDRVDDALEAVSLLDRAESFISALSKGMRQRVGLAQAIMHEPDALILDEPTIGLDPQQVVDIRDLIARLGKKHTILLSTHIMSEVEQICDRVIMVFNGRIGADMQLKDLLGTGAAPALSLQLALPTSETVAALQAVEGVIAAVAEADGLYRLEYDGQDETRLRLVDRVQEKGWGLLGLQSERMTLESAFLRQMRAADALRLPEPAAETPRTAGALAVDEEE